jgi:hypothetical protein
MWWLHLLVRRADSRDYRNLVHELLTRAVGAMRYHERLLPLLLGRANDVTVLCYTFQGSGVGARNILRHGIGDVPAISWADGSRVWYASGKRTRASGKPYAVLNYPGYEEGFGRWEEWTHKADGDADYIVFLYGPSD